MAKRPFQSLRGKVGLALIGACLIGGTSAVLAAHTVNEQVPALAYSSSNSVNNTQNTSTTGSQSTTGTGSQSTTGTGSGTGSRSSTSTTGSGGGGGGGGGGANPTATSPAGILPTATPRPTPTPFITGQSCHVSGSITGINTAGNTFTVQYFGRSYTVDVNSGTSFTFTPLGATTPQPSTFSALTVGWETSVNGTAQASSTCLASTVHSFIDN